MFVIVTDFGFLDDHLREVSQLSQAYRFATRSEARSEARHYITGSWRIVKVN